MTLPLELTRHGMDVRLVDKASGRTDKPEAMVRWSRTLEPLDRGGSRGSAPFVDAGFRRSVRSAAVVFSLQDHHPRMMMAAASIRQAKPSPKRAAPLRRRYAPGYRDEGVMCR